MKSCPRYSPYKWLVHKLKTFTHSCLVCHKRDIGKHCKPISDATECGIWSGSTLLEWNKWVTFKNRQKDTRQLLIEKWTMGINGLISDTSVNLLVLTQSNGTFCVCYQHHVHSERKHSKSSPLPRTSPLQRTSPKSPAYQVWVNIISCNVKNFTNKWIEYMYVLFPAVSSFFFSFKLLCSTCRSSYMSHVMRKPAFAIYKQQSRRSAGASAPSDQRSAVVVCCLDRIIPLLAIAEISRP